MPPKKPAPREDLGTLTRPAVKERPATKRKTARPPLYEVVIHNDDYTWQEFVVLVLMRFFNHDHETARQIMLHVHTKGVGVAGVYPYDVAETKVQLTTDLARKNEFPLLVTMRREGGGAEGHGEGGDRGSP